MADPDLAGSRRTDRKGRGVKGGAVTPEQIFRVLIIEDDQERARRLTGWLPDYARAVVARSAGQALGILSRDGRRTYGAILLDHDLQGATITEKDRGLDGKDVMDAILKHVSKDVPILIHSMNPTQGRIMANVLDSAGFDVEKIPMESLSGPKFRQWIESAKEIREDAVEDGLPPDHMEAT